MDVIWDPAKAWANWKKHGVSFPDAVTVLWDPNALTKEDPDSENEQRFVTLGLDSIGRVLVVIYAYEERHSAYLSENSQFEREKEL
jgi:hypothetical protein